MTFRLIWMARTKTREASNNGSKLLESIRETRRHYMVCGNQLFVDSYIRLFVTFINHAYHA